MNTVFQSSRLTGGNLFFPDTLIISEDKLTFSKDSWFSSRAKVTNFDGKFLSFRVDDGIFFSDLEIHNLSGVNSLKISGLWKSDAAAIREVLEARLIAAIRRRNFTDAITRGGFSQ